jgi:hypothetical protein
MVVGRTRLRRSQHTLYFWHIPKTGGSSVREWLASHAGSDLCPAGIADQLVTMPFGELVRYRIFAGHFHGYLAPYLAREVVTCTLLRDPVARTRSHWHEVRRTASHPHHARVRGQSFAEFVEDDCNRVMIEDYQARYLAQLPIDMAALARRFSGSELSRYALAEALEQASLRVAKPVLATLARKTLASMVVVGVCQRLHEFLVEVGQMFEISAPAAVPRANVTEHDDGGTLTPAVLARLRDLTRVDQELYDFVWAQVQR